MVAQYPYNDANKTKRNRWMVGCGVGAVIILCGIGFLVFGGFAGILAIFGGEPEGLTVNVNHPTMPINVGDFFDVEIDLINDGTRNIRIREIQLPKELLANAIVTGVDPGGVLGMDIGNRTAYNFDFVIAPRGQERVSFQLQAINEADITGEIGVPVGTRTNLSRIRLVVSAVEVAVVPEETAVIPEELDVTPEEIDVIPEETVVVPEDESVSSMGDVIPYQSVVQIIVLVESGNQLVEVSWGSGTIISEDGLILTNEHVISSRMYVPADLLVAVTVEPDQPPEPMFFADVLQADYYLDLAVLKIRSDLQGNPVDLEALGIEPVPLGNSDELQLGDPMVIIGYPGIGGQTITLTRGEVSGFTAEDPYGNRAFIKTSGTIAGGNSGGLAATPQGALVGIPTQAGSGDREAGVVDCRYFIDTNRDGVIDEKDQCIPIGGFINALRPVALALPLIEAAKAGEVAIVGPYVQEYEEVEMGSDRLLDEIFTDNNNDWLVFDDDEEGSIAIENGNLTIGINHSFGFLLTYMQYNFYDDPIFSTNAFPIVSTGDGEFGLTCLNVENDLYYVFSITEDGWYALYKWDGVTESWPVEWTYSDHVDQSTNYEMAAYCGSEGLAFALNDLLLISIEEPVNIPMQVGLSAGTYEVAGFMVGFDAFIVWRP